MGGEAMPNISVRLGHVFSTLENVLAILVQF